VYVRISALFLSLGQYHYIEISFVDVEKFKWLENVVRKYSFIHEELKDHEFGEFLLQCSSLSFEFPSPAKNVKIIILPVVLRRCQNLSC
jgi:hypothetical protein